MSIPETAVAPAAAALGKVVIVNTADRGGGAERVAIDILDGFEALGTTTALLVGAKRSDDPRVMPLWASPNVDYRAHAHRHRQLELRARRRVIRLLGLEDFEHPYSAYALDLAGSRPDLLLCVNLHGGFFDLRAIAPLSRQIPLVVRLDDSWLLTGHCAVPRGCTRWRTGCGSCPQLQIPPAIVRDATRWNWRRKRRILSRARLAVLAPSRWMMQRAQQSLLSENIETSAVIPNGVDVSVLAPGSRGAARAAVGVDPHADVLLFVAHGGHHNPHKDFATLRAAMRMLAARSRHRALELVVVGAQAPHEQLAANTRICHLKARPSARELVSLYRAADLYVHASWEESFGLTVAEALACGLPVVATAAGALPEVIDDGVTGLLVTVGDAAALAAAIESLLDDPRRRRQMARAAAEAARARFDARRQIAAMHDWCSEVATAWHVRRASL